MVGESAHVRSVGVDLARAGVGDEGFVIRTAPPHLIIAGGRRRGTMYGVYAFLEEHLGCRWFTPSVSHIPRRQRLELGAMVNPEASRLPYTDWYRGAVDRFFSVAQQAGITHVRESSRPLSTMADFKRELEAGVADREDGDLATE